MPAAISRSSATDFFLSSSYVYDAILPPDNPKKPALFEDTRKLHPASTAQVPLEERERTGPGSLRRRLPVAFRIREVHERMPGVRVRMELVRLAAAGELGIELDAVGGRGVVVLLPEVELQRA